MSRIVEELERQGIEVTYDNIAIFAVFASEEGLVERLKLNDSTSEECERLNILPKSISKERC